MLVQVRVFDAVMSVPLIVVPETVPLTFMFEQPTVPQFTFVAETVPVVTDVVTRAVPATSSVYAGEFVFRPRRRVVCVTINTGSSCVAMLCVDRFRGSFVPVAYNPKP